MTLNRGATSALLNKTEAMTGHWPGGQQGKSCPNHIILGPGSPLCGAPVALRHITIILWDWDWGGGGRGDAVKKAGKTMKVLPLVH